MSRHFPCTLYCLQIFKLRSNECHFSHFACSYWAMPGFWLRRQIMLNLPCENLEFNVANSVDFMVERVSQGSMQGHHWVLGSQK